MREDVYLIGEAGAITGVSPRKLRWWERHALLRPSIAAPPPKRHAKAGRPKGVVDRLYSRDDLLVAVLIQRMQTHGLSLQRIRKATATLRARFGDKPLYQALEGRAFRLLVGSKTVAVEDNERRVWDVLNREQAVAQFALDGAVESTTRLIAAWRRTKRQAQRRAEALILARLHHRQVRHREALENVMT